MLFKLKSLFCAAMLLVGLAAGAAAQNVELRQWHGSSSIVRQSEQVLASSMTEWRSLWSRVGVHPPDGFEPGRMNAIGIFLGQRPGPYSVNVLSAARRRDRIMIVFEERGPSPDVMVAQRAAPPPPPPPPVIHPNARALSAGPNFVPPAAGFAPPNPGSTLPAPTPAPRPSIGPPTSPWAIVLINRTDLPITVEQRLFR